MSKIPGVRTATLAIPPGGVLAETTLKATTGRLKAVTALAATAVAPNDTFLEIGIKQDGTNFEHTVAVLIDGPLSPLGTLSWDGNIPMTDTCSIYIRGTSSIARGISLRAWIIQKEPE